MHQKPHPRNIAGDWWEIAREWRGLLVLFVALLYGLQIASITFEYNRELFVKRGVKLLVENFPEPAQERQAAQYVARVAAECAVDKI